MNLAYAFVDTSFMESGTMIELDLFGESASVQVIDPAPYDPASTLMRQ
jgi:glycine cleavage system aminomethyltransferase T